MAFGYKRIFAALDGSSTQRAVMERAISLAAADGAELILGHVIDSVPTRLPASTSNCFATKARPA